MKKSVRLTRSSDFQRVLGAGRLYNGRSLIAFAQPGRTSSSRVGVTVSRQVKGAVRRNRARRRIREVVRQRMLHPDSPLLSRGRSYDVVVIARPAALALPFAVLDVDAEQVLTRLLGREAGR